MDDISRQPDQDVRLPVNRGAKGPSEVVADEARIVDEAAPAHGEPLGEPRIGSEALRIERLRSDTARVEPDRHDDREREATADLPVAARANPDSVPTGDEASDAAPEVAPTAAAPDDEDAFVPLTDVDELARVSLALLLSQRDGVTVLRLAEVTGATPKLVDRALDVLGKLLDEQGLPIELARAGDRVRVLTRPVVYPYVERLKNLKKAAQLSPAALETLAVIAYRQPVIRAEIESIRGVKAGPMLRSLLENKLVKVTGRADVPGRPLQYGTTQTFLERFGLNSLKELPSIQEFKSLG